MAACTALLVMRIARRMVSADDDPAVRLAIAQGDLTMRGVEADSRASTAALESRVRAAIAYAEMLGAQAAAGLNALNANASISGSDSTVRNVDTE